MQALVIILMGVGLIVYSNECNEEERRFQLEMEQRRLDREQMERLGWSLVSSTELKLDQGVFQ